MRPFYSYFVFSGGGGAPLPGSIGGDLSQTTPEIRGRLFSLCPVQGSLRGFLGDSFIFRGDFFQYIHVKSERGCLGEHAESLLILRPDHLGVYAPPLLSFASRRIPSSHCDFPFFLLSVQTPQIILPTYGLCR